MADAKPRKKPGRVPVDLAGTTSSCGRWRVLRRHPGDRGPGNVRWECTCVKCGQEKLIHASNLGDGNAGRCWTCHPVRPTRRIMFPPDPQVLATCGRDLDGDGEENASAQIQSMLARHAALIEQAAGELETTLTRSEWNLLAEVMTSSGDLWRVAESSERPLTLTMLTLSAMKSIAPVGVDVPALVNRLDGLSPTHAETIVAAIRWLRIHPEVNRDADSWWSPGWRRNAQAQANGK